MAGTAAEEDVVAAVDEVAGSIMGFGVQGVFLTIPKKGATHHSISAMAVISAVIDSVSVSPAIYSAVPVQHESRLGTIGAWRFCLVQS